VNLGAVASDLSQVFGVPDYTSAPQAVKDRLLIDINAAIQQLQDAGEDFYAREDLTVDLVANTQGYTLPKNIQTVLDDVMLDDGTVLKKLTSYGQFLQAGQLFLDQLDNVVPAGTPQFYFVDSQRDTADTTGDNVATTISLVPKPSTAVAAAANLIVPVIKEPTPVTAGQLTAGTSSLPVPHKYVESIFLPLARWNATTSYLFYDKERLSRYEDEYVRALKLLGKADPRVPKPTDSKPDALEKPAPTGGGQ
jgi:hypothetical protein